MTNTMTRKPLRVWTDATAGPSVLLPLSQLDDVRRVLDFRQIKYRVEENVVSLDGGPETVVINFGRSGDAVAIQAALDSIP